MFMYLNARVLCFGRSKTCKLRASKGERGSDKNRAETLESVLEGLVWGVPVSRTNIASGITLDATTVIYNTEYNAVESILDDVFRCRVDLIKSLTSQYKPRSCTWTVQIRPHHN